MFGISSRPQINAATAPRSDNGTDFIEVSNSDIYGTGGGDYIRVSGTGNTIHAGRGDDQITSSNGIMNRSLSNLDLGAWNNNVVHAGPGDDVINGQKNDALFGGTGNDAYDVSVFPSEYGYQGPRGLTIDDNSGGYDTLQISTVPSDATKYELREEPNNHVGVYYEGERLDIDGIEHVEILAQSLNGNTPLAGFHQSDVFGVPVQEDDTYQVRSLNAVSETMRSWPLQGQSIFTNLEHMRRQP
jgi:hypothetical protein